MGFEVPEVIEDKGKQDTVDSELVTKDIRTKRQTQVPKKFKDFELHLIEALTVGQYPAASTPKTFDEAMENRWEQAIKEKIEGLTENKTWELVPLPEWVNVIDSK
ncbi:hypothetical protein PR048_008496 [Dryococelus australis]|uniref:Uncharacterized protein n=1 Tax=Dryococelus australis TaxID=614101 RepID=A0ABQ9HX91_9NEOP|nr:hypothetical protein PR048_008496 [Dryococelus australis]